MGQKNRSVWLTTPRAWTAAALGCAALFGARAWADGGGVGGSPTVITNNGPIIGTTVSGNPSVNAFLGVPYAAPPVGNLRFASPAPHASWSTPLRTTQFAPPCTQLSPTGPTGSEDCLYLNVFAPAVTFNAPIMIFLPGGQFQFGSASERFYNAQAIAAKGHVIVVTVTYRVGALGFLTAPALDAQSPNHVSGNYGILDQQAAISWIRANAGAFGGNANNLTVFGESAGANSTEYQLVSPLVRGQFQQAIIESAVGVPGVPNLTLAQQEAGAGSAIVSQVGCANAPNTAACLRALPAFAFLFPPSRPDLTVNPVIDGYVLPLAPIAAFSSGNFNRVPVIYGTNHDELTSLVALTFPQAANPPLTSATYAALITQLFGPIAPVVLAQYPASSYASPLQAFATVGTDGFIVCQAEQKRAALARYVQVYGYEFNEPNPAQGPIFGPPIPGLTYGDYHTSELPYVFGVDSPNGVPLTGKDLALSQKMISYWTNFATYAFPSAVPVPGNPVWPNYLQGQLLSLKDSVGNEPLGSFDNDHKCSFWNH